MRIAFFFLLSLLVDSLGWILVPVGLLFCNKDSLHLPSLFWLWDNDIEGINGDIYWRTDPTHHPNDYSNFWVRYTWLAWRNPSNNFITFVLGFSPNWDTQYTVTGNVPTDYKIVAHHQGKDYPMWMIQKPYERWPQHSYRVYIGWRNEGCPKTKPVSFVFTIQVWKTAKAV